MKIIYQYQTKKRIYELTDHLGNVRAVIKREKDADNRAQIIKASDYYPFGMEMPGRKYASEAYRYGYQGQFAEKDGETGLHHFELRQWDARIARWNSTDPYGQYFSPYMGMGNNPVSLVDPDGGYTKIGAWIRNGFSSKGLYEVGGEWGFNTGGLSGSGFLDANGNFTTGDMNIQFNGSDGLSNAFDNFGSFVNNFGSMINGNGGWEPKTHANHVGDKSIDMTYSNAPFEVVKNTVNYLLKTESDPRTKGNGDTLLINYTDYRGKTVLHMGIMNINGNDTMLRIFNRWDDNTGGLRPTMQDYIKYR